MKRVKKQYCITWLLMVCTACITYIYRDTLYDVVSINVVKYVSMAFAITTSTVMMLYISSVSISLSKRVKIVLFYIGNLFLVFYTLLTLDTFIFHIWYWYPGILRYAVFDAYGVCYLVFILPGLCLYAGIQKKVAK